MNRGIEDDGRSFIHTGVVVHDDNKLDSPIRGAVLDIDELLETGYISVKALSHLAFKLPTAKLNLEMSTKKNLIRRLEKPILFGEFVEFNVREHVTKRNHITSFERTNALLKSRIHNGCGQLLLEGVINPNDPSHFFTEYFRNILIPEPLQKQASPNIYLEAWINIHYIEDRQQSFSIDYTFHSFHGVCSQDRQFSIGTAPWNVSIERFSVFAAPPDEDEEDEEYGKMASMIANPKKIAGLPDLELHRREAYMTGDRSFLLVEFPQYKCLTPLKKPEASLRVGNLYVVNCHWNMYEKMYVVQHLVASRKTETLNIDVDSNLIRCTVCEHPKYRGVFFNSKFGYMYDPDCLLAYLHLTKFHSNNVPVAFADDGPSRSGQFRFRITSILSDRSEKIFKYMDGNLIKLSQCVGIVIGAKSVFSAEHSGLIFIFQDGENLLEPGVGIIFDAAYNKEDKQFYITSWSKNPNSATLATEIRQMSKNSAKEQTIFNVKVRRCPEVDLNKMLYCEEFGLVDDNMGMVSEMTGTDNQSMENVWVKISSTDYYEFAPRTKFHIIAVGTDAPSNQYQEPIINEEDTYLRKRLEEAVRESSRRFDTIFEPRIVSLPAPIAYADTSSSSGMSRASSYSGASLTSETIKDNWSECYVASTGGGASVDDEDIRGSRLNVKHNTISRTEPSFAASPTLSKQFDNVSLSQSPNSPVLNHSYHGYQGYESGLDYLSDAYSVSSRCTEDGGIDPRKHKSTREHVPAYTGAVPSDNPAYKFNIVETLSRLKKHIPHDKRCGSKCAPDCEYLREVARLVVHEDGFWQEAQERYSAISKELDKCLLHVIHQ